jgi:hypothetical protein
MMLVVAMQRINDGGTPSRLIVTHSSTPSSRLAAADGQVPAPPGQPANARHAGFGIQFPRCPQQALERLPPLVW